MANAKEKKSDTHFVLEAFTKGWPGSGFEHRYTDLKVRRCIGGTSKQDEAQIEIGIHETKGEKQRTFVHCGELTLTPDQARALALALCPELAKAGV